MTSPGLWNSIDEGEVDMTTQVSPESELTRIPRLVGIGVGPGDPDLITIKAVQELENSDLIFVPSSETSLSDTGRAEAIISAICPDVVNRIRRISFSMARNGEDRNQAWQSAAQDTINGFASGAKTIAFATVGDPSVYSTFSYLADIVRQEITCEVSVIPGITAMQALAAARLTPLVEGQEVLALVPLTAGLDKFCDALDYADTVVAYKIGRNLENVATMLRDRNRMDTAVIGTDIGLSGESIKALSEVEDSVVPYFATVIIPPVRTHTGSRL